MVSWFKSLRHSLVKSVTKVRGTWTKRPREIKLRIYGEKPGRKKIYARKTKKEKYRSLFPATLTDLRQTIF